MSEPLVGIALPQHGHDRPFSPAEIAQIAARAEEAGFSHLWTADGLFSPGSFFEPLQVLAFVAAHTTTIRLGVSALVLPRRHPFQLAHAAVTLDHLCAGRLDLTVAVGEANVVEGFVSPTRRGRYVEEAVTVMRALWERDVVTADGPMFPLQGKSLHPRPVQRPFPLWFGGRADRALARAARLGTGWIGSGAQASDSYGETVNRMLSALADAGRDAATFPIGKRAYIAIDQAPQAVENWFAASYGSAAGAELATAATITGDRDHILEELLHLRASGAELLIVHPVGDEIAQFEAVAYELLPRLRSEAVGA